MGTPPHPTRHPSKNVIFLFFVRVRNVKNTTQVAKFALSLGPCPYHLPPRNQSPWTPPLYPPPQKNDASCEICSAPGPAIFPAPKPLDPPPSPNLGPRGLGLPTHQPSPNPPPFSSSPYPRPPTLQPRAFGVSELSSPYAPPNPLLQPRPLVYPPVHQASSGG